MGILDGKKGIVFGVANDRSIAWHIGRNLIEHGATCGFSHLPGEKMERRVRRTLEEGGLKDPWLCPCDVSKDEDLDAVFAAITEKFDAIDFVVHSLAFADREYLKMGNFAETPRGVWSQALDISAWTLVGIANRARKIMPRGGSIISMTYYGAEKVVPGYNVMGVAKAALETATRYLAAELGAQNIRVNSVSAGPCRTLSAMAVGGIEEMFDWVEKKAPLKRNIETDEVGKSAVFLISDLSTGVTGENLYVDAGYNIIGL
jgi:enoyl-[acyl-carrier protein] reductase I